MRSNTQFICNKTKCIKSDKKHKKHLIIKKDKKQNNYVNFVDYKRHN